MPEEYVFVGTYTQTKSKGIYGFRMQDGKITEPVLLAERVSPTYLCVNREQSVLYAVDEPDTGAGTLGSYRIEYDDAGRVTGLSLLSSLTAPSLGMCHVVLSPDERFLLAVSYNDAHVMVYSIGEQGAIACLTDCIERTGKGPHPVRQPSAHAHSVTFAPDGSFLYVCDLGTDDLAAYSLSAEGKLIVLPDKTVHVPNGYGPRHMVFSPDGRYAYVVAEIVDRLLVYGYEDGRMTLLQDLAATEREDPSYTAAAVRVTRDGRYVYISNRGEETVTGYEVQEDGELIEMQRIQAQGLTPREFILSLDERYAFTGNQDSDTLGFYTRDPETGLLAADGATDAIGQPVCILPVAVR